MHLYILDISNFSAFHLYANLVIFCNSYSDVLKELRQKSLSVLISNPYNYVIPRPCAIKPNSNELVVCVSKDIEIYENINSRIHEKSWTTIRAYLNFPFL